MSFSKVKGPKTYFSLFKKKSEKHAFNAAHDLSKIIYLKKNFNISPIILTFFLTDIILTFNGAYFVIFNL